MIGDSVGLKSDDFGYEKQSKKPMKYYTQNFFDQGLVNTRGIFFNDGFGIPSAKIDKSTKSRFGKMTNINLVQNLPALPLNTTPGMVNSQGPVLIEDSIRPQHNRNLKQCNPKDTQYYKRHFSIFDNLPVSPNGCVDNVVQNGPAFYQGIDTRRL